MRTTQALAEITDAGLFEKVATSVLRYAEPGIYGNVSHQGVNPQGKTVKAPLDNVGWHKAGVDEMLVSIAHTTTSKSDLEAKWLRDLDKVKPRKQGGKPTGTDGDLVKAIKEINKIREDNPDIKARLALAINCEESQELRTKVQLLASEHNIELDIWSVSRLADFLDTNPDGQIIRRNHFDVAPIRLSKQLLLEIGEESLLNLNFDAELFTERDLKPIQKHTVVVGVSGSGKSTYCIDVLNQHLNNHRPVLVLTDDTVSQAVSIEEAIDVELHRYSKDLIPQSGRQALELCSIDKPLIILVEDVNRSSDSARLLRKLIDWSNSNASFILLCPVWHRLMASLSFEERKSLEAHFKLDYLENYNEDEANRAIIARATKEQIRVDELLAANIAQQLGYDPLLISLANLAELHKNANVIEEYVRKTIQSIAAKNDLFVYEIEDAINEYGLHLFQNKKLQGAAQDLKALSRDSQKVLKQVLNDGRLFRQSFESQDYAILSRHDRLNFYIIAKSIMSYLEGDSFDLTDPYFAEIIGISCALANLDNEKLYQISIQNNLVAFHCYAFSAKTNSSYLDTAINNVRKWLEVPENQSDVYDSQLYQSLIILNDVFHTSVPEILNLYNERHQNYLFYQISFKNGNLNDGLKWISAYPLEVSMTGEKQIIDYVVHKYGESLVRKICNCLIDDNVNYDTKHSLLLLIGYTENTVFADFVRKAWLQISDDKKDYRIFFWAAARVCDDEPHTLLAPIFNYWEGLSDEEDEYHSTEKADFAAYDLRWIFKEYVPHNSIEYILKEAERREGLSFYVLYMLHEVDHPKVLEAQAIRLANNRRQGNHLPSSVLDSLRRDFEDGKTLSIESKQELLSMSENLDNDGFLKESAFRLWEISPHYDDLFILRQIVKDDVRFEIALMGRAKRKDFTDIDGLVERINENPSYWWQATRYIWHVDFEKLLESTVANISGSSDLYSNDLWMIDELFEKLETQKAELLLIKYWDNLSNHTKFIQIALMIATPNLQELVASKLENSSNIEEFFINFRSTLGVRTRGRKGIHRYEQIEAVEPYFKYLEDSLLFSFASICLEKDWQVMHRKIKTIIKDEDYKRTVVISVKDLEKAYSAETSLEKLKVSFFSYDWINSQKRLGWSHQKIVEALFDWFNLYCDAQALNTVSKPLSESGKRTDYIYLENLLKGMIELPNKQKVLDRLYFNIYSRSLE